MMDERIADEKSFIPVSHLVGGKGGERLVPCGKPGKATRNIEQWKFIALEISDDISQFLTEFERAYVPKSQEWVEN
jgi:hypothetical protein